MRSPDGMPFLKFAGISSQSILRGIDAPNGFGIEAAFC